MLNSIVPIFVVLPWGLILMCRDSWHCTSICSQSDRYERGLFLNASFDWVLPCSFPATWTSDAPSFSTTANFANKDNAMWILNFTVTFRGKGINFRRVNEVSGDVSCSLWWNLGIWSFSVDRFNQLTTGGGWDKPVLVDIMSAGKLLGIASAATPNSTKNHCCIPLSLTIPAKKSRIASLLMHTCYYKIFLRAVDLLIFSPEITRSRKTIFWEKKHIIKVSIKS